MIIAIPTVNGKLCAHFGHTEKFSLVEVDSEKKEILNRKDIDAPPHQPGLLPGWLAEKKVNTVIAGGLGQKARELLGTFNITTIIGATEETPELLVNEYLQGKLVNGINTCNH